MRGITWYHMISHWHHVMHHLRQLAWRTEEALSRHNGVNDIIWCHVTSYDVIWCHMMSCDSTCDGVWTLHRLSVIAWQNWVFLISHDIMWCHMIWFDIIWYHMTAIVTKFEHEALHCDRPTQSCTYDMIWYDIISYAVIWYHMIHFKGRRGQLPCQAMINIWKLTSSYDVI